MKSILRNMVFAIGMLMLLVMFYLILPEQKLEGTAKALDGDSLRLGEVEIRLLGLDAPEYRQTCIGKDGAEWSCGIEARNALARILKNSNPLRCVGDGVDKFGRQLARCETSDGKDVTAEMLRLGFAVSNDAFFGHYAKAQSEARDQKRGIWQGSFENPRDYRQRNR